MDFESLKYAELQSIAKKLGLKANVKTEKLLKAIKEHYQQKAEKSQAPEKQPTAVEEDENASNAQSSTEASNNDEIFHPPVFVNTLRGKRTGGKRKICDAALVNESDGPASAEGGAEEASSAASFGNRAAKKRKASSAKDGQSVSVTSQQQPGTQDEVPGTDAEKVKMAKARKIPRLQKKHSTPNFKKLHQAEFEKMESIESYVQRRTRILKMDGDSAKDSKDSETKIQEPKHQETEKLLKAIKEHYQQKAEKSQAPEKQPTAVEEDENASNAQSSTEASNNDEIFHPPVFVNTLRGKRTGGKRKICDAALVNESDGPASAEGGAEEASSAASFGNRAAKKRKASSAKDGQSVSVTSQQQPGTQDEVPGTDAEKVKMAKARKIPRLQKKHSTPNFKKLHQAEFEKMESIESYVQRRTRILKMDGDSAKDSKRSSRAPLFSPAPNRRAGEEKPVPTVLPAAKAPPSKPAGKEDAAFRPSVISIRRVNIRFSEATCDNENKRRVVKTPTRLPSCVASSTPLTQPCGVKADVFSASKTPGPFVFTGNSSRASSPRTQKPRFDLKASLSRPLTYKPHTGKLKPFGDVKENPSANKSLVSANKSLVSANKSLVSTNKSLVSAGTRQKSYKQHQAKTREDRRAEQVEDRKRKKEGALGARRGLVMM